MTGVWRARRVVNHKPSGEILAEGPTRADVDHLWCPGVVAITWDAEERPIRRWPQETVARVRKARLKRRLEKKLPLFADQLYDAELAARPDYYAAEDRAQ